MGATVGSAGRRGNRMTTYPAIVQRPDAWCCVCGQSWTANSIAVRFAPLQPMVCGERLVKASDMVKAEQRRRADDELARRGENAR